MRGRRFYTVHPRRSHRPTLRAINPTFSTTSTYLHDGKEGETSVRSGVAVRTGVRSTAWTYLTGRSRRRLRKKEKKKIDKVRFFYSPRTRRRAARAPVSSAPSPQARAMIEYHKCRVSSFSNWVSIPCRNQPVAGRDLPRYSHRARPPLRRSSSTKRPSRHSPPKFSSSSSRRRSATLSFEPARRGA